MRNSVSYLTEGGVKIILLSLYCNIGLNNITVDKVFNKY